MDSDQLQQLVTEMVLEALAEATRKAIEIPNWHDDDLLTDTQAAKVLNVAKGTLPVWRHRGRGPSFIKLGSTVRYRYGDLRQYIQDNRQY